MTTVTQRLYIINDADRFEGTTTATKIALRTKTTATASRVAFTIDTTGNVYIGNRGYLSGTGPNLTEHAHYIQDATISEGDTTPIVASWLLDTYTTSGVVSQLELRRSRGSFVSPSAVLDGDDLGLILFYGFDGTNMNPPCPVSIEAYAKENFTSSAHGSELVFYTCNPGSTTRVISTIMDYNQNLVLGDNFFNGITRTLAIKTGTAPTGGFTNYGIMWAETIAGTVELRVADSAGNIRTISPHNFSMFDPDPEEFLPWSYYSKNHYVGKEIGVDMAGAIRAIEKLTGKQFIYYRDLLPEEVRDWDTDQKTQVLKSKQELAIWKERQAETILSPTSAAGSSGCPEPEVVVPTPPPTWMRSRISKASVIPDA